MVLARTAKLLLGTAICLTMLCNGVVAKGVSKDTARMQAMDKITGRVSEIDVPVNGEVRFGTFSVVIRACNASLPEETPENTAFVDVVDNYDKKNAVNIFKGWMFSSSPALNAVEHPIYDVWLLKCFNSKDKNKKALTTEELKLRDELPMFRHDTLSAGKSPLIDIPEKNIDDTLNNNKISSVQEDGEPKVIMASEVQPIIDDVIQEDGAPKSLIAVSRAEVDKDREVVDTNLVNERESSEDASVVNNVLNGLKENAVSVEEIDRQSDVLLLPQDEISETTEVIPDSGVSGFDEEVEEEGFEM